MAIPRQFWANLIIMFLGVGTIGAFLVLSLVTAAQPATSVNPGWVAVLQPGAALGAGEILLQAEAAIPGAPGDHPSLVYSVLACGHQPFRGVLLLGGTARLDDILVVDQHLITSADPVPTAPHVTSVPDLSLESESYGKVWHLGPVQKIPIVIDQLMPCSGPTGADQPFIGGTGTTVSGFARGPIQRVGSFLGVHGPHTSQVWPLVGGFPPARPNELGEFIGVGGLQGTWSIPAALHKQVVSGSLTARAIVDVAIPPLADASRAVWDSGTPLQATVSVTSVDDLDRWQNWLTASTIFLGVGAALLAALLFEWLRPTREGGSVVLTTTADFATHVARLKSTAHKRSPIATGPIDLLAIAALAVAAYVLRRTRR